MKIVIEHNGVKRIIEGAFNVCGGYSDLMSMLTQIYGQIERERLKLDGSESPIGFYGWVSVLPREVREKGSSGPPIGWNDAG